MFEYIKLKNKLTLLEVENRELKDILKESTPKQVVFNIMDKGLTYVEYEKLNKAERIAYYKTVREFLDNKVITNEKNKIISSLVEDIAYRSGDFESVEKLRMTINGIELFFERLLEISPTENEEESLEEPFLGI